ncbi:MAG: oxidoreductase [Candidatus Binatia bacterium]|nr:MAG: oxidoreductase [Candidatus Binatia bacterium]
MDYTGRVAIVTGASSGIGRQVAVDLAARGVRTVLVARRKDKLEEVLATVRPRSPESFFVVADVAERDTPARVVRETHERFGRIDILVNNAGISKRKHILRLTMEEIEHVMRVNFFAAAAFTLEVLPIMRARGEGYIVNVSSMVGRFGNPRESAYCASKFAMTGFAEAAYFDLEPYGIHVGFVNTGPIDTEIWSHDEEPTYRGKLYPPSVVSAAVFRCIEGRKPEVTAPPLYRLPILLHVLAPSLMRFGMKRTVGGGPLPEPAATKP